MIGQKARTFTVLLALLILISLSLVGGLFYLLQKERDISASLNQQLEETKAKQRIIEAKLEDSKKMISEFELKIKDNQIQIDSLTSDLQAEKDARQEALNQLEGLRAELEQQKNIRTDLENKLTQAQSDANKAYAQLNELEAKKTELEEKAKQLEIKSNDLEARLQGIELGTIVVKPKAAEQPKKKVEKPAKEKKVSKTAIVETKKEAEEPKEKPPAAVVASLEGTVVANNKEYNFVVINLGSKEGVKINSIFSIYHNDKYVGDVKIEKVHDFMSAAGYLSEEIKDKIFEGDRAIQKNK